MTRSIAILCALPIIGLCASAFICAAAIPLNRTNLPPFVPRTVVLTIQAGSNDLIQASTDLHTFNTVMQANGPNVLMLTNPAEQVRVFRAVSRPVHLTWNLAGTNAGSVTVLQWSEDRSGFWTQNFPAITNADMWPIGLSFQHFVVYQTDTNGSVPMLSQFSNRADLTPVAPTITETVTNFLESTNAP